MSTLLRFVQTWLSTRLPRDEKGQDGAEYALLIAFIALVIVAGATLLGTNINTVFNNIAGAIAAWPVP